MPSTLPHVEPAVAPQPDGVAWPTTAWPTGEPPDGVSALVDAAFEDPSLEATYAVVVVQGGRLVAERYGGALPSFTEPPRPVTVDTPLLGWSMTKSVLHGAIGVLVDEGRLALDEPAPVAEWSAAGDPRGRITLRDLLEMRDGLAWTEDYLDDQVSDTIEMLFGPSAVDTAAYAASHPLAVEPGTRFNYSSGTSNIVARILGDVVGHGEAVAHFLEERLFAPIGIADATVRLDDAGTFIGSTFAYCSARSWAKFATLYLRGGTFDGREVLSRSWVDTAQVPTSRDDTSADTYYSLHWWLDGRGTYSANGYQGQRLVISPARDAIVVRLGRTDAARYPAIRAWWESMLDVLG